MSERPDDLERQLYPFLFADGGRAELGDVLADVAASTLQKCEDVIELRRRLLDEVDDLVDAAEDMAAAFRAGATLLAFGNGGSATDAEDLVADCLEPVSGDRPLPALSLTADVGVVTAVGNDVGFENVFSRQVIAFGRPGDIAVGFSTSGTSPNVLAGLSRAREMGLLTVGIAGYDGGELRDALEPDHCFIVPSSYVPRIQEVHATIYHTLLELVRLALGPSFHGGSPTAAGADR